MTQLMINLEIHYNNDKKYTFVVIFEILKSRYFRHI